MEPIVYFAVLAAAACHAGWNALLKLKLEPIAATVLMAGLSAVVALPFACAWGPPKASAWPYLLGSAVIHIVYFLTLAEAYRYGDLGQVYPIARGTAPLMTAVVAALWLREELGPYGWSGVILLACGIVLLALKGGRTLQQLDRRALRFALLTALTITFYTLVDGLGARATGSAMSYTSWLFLLNGVTMVAYGYLRIGPRMIDDLRDNWRIGAGGALLSTAAYTIAIWAMTVAPIALVAALRETSVLFAALLGVVLLREPLLPVRIAAAMVVLSGALLLRLH